MSRSLRSLTNNKDTNGKDTRYLTEKIKAAGLRKGVVYRCSSSFKWIGAQPETEQVKSFCVACAAIYGYISLIEISAMISLNFQLMGSDIFI